MRRAPEDSVGTWLSLAACRPGQRGLPAVVLATSWDPCCRRAAAADRSREHRCCLIHAGVGHCAGGAGGVPFDGSLYAFLLP